MQTLLNKRKFEVRVMAVAILDAMLSDLPYIEVDTTEHAQEWSFVVLGALNFDNFASFVPELASQRGLLA